MDSISAPFGKGRRSREWPALESLWLYDLPQPDHEDIVSAVATYRAALGTNLDHGRRKTRLRTQASRLRTQAMTNGESSIIAVARLTAAHQYADAARGRRPFNPRLALAAELRQVFVRHAGAAPGRATSPDGLARGVFFEWIVSIVEHHRLDLSPEYLRDLATTTNRQHRRV